VLDTHSHDFAVEALVVQGEMWLTLNGQTQHLKPGDRFNRARDVSHAERYGSQGATYGVARC
jgi:quercetin dioxygenase-like cupin family protein